MNDLAFLMSARVVASGKIMIDVAYARIKPRAKNALLRGQDMKRFSRPVSMIVVVVGSCSSAAEAQVASAEITTTAASRSTFIYHNVMIPMRDGVRLATDV